MDEQSIETAEDLAANILEIPKNKTNFPFIKTNFPFINEFIHEAYLGKGTVSSVGKTASSVMILSM